MEHASINDQVLSVDEIVADIEKISVNSFVRMSVSSEVKNPLKEI